MISGDRLKEHMDIINGKLEDHDILVDLIEQMSTMSSLSFQNKNYGKGDIITDIKKFQKNVDGNY